MSASAPSRASLWRRGLLFLLVYGAFNLGWQSLHNTPVEQFIVHNATVVPAVWIANGLTPALQARAVGTTIKAPGGGLNILNGCEGLDALFLLIAAFCVAPLPWRARMRGVSLGILLVFIVNQARILGLLYAYRADPQLFQPLHGLIAPLAVVLIISGYFYVYLERSTQPLAGTR
jgi:exosortase/archaeosortase family protein